MENSATASQSTAGTSPARTGIGDKDPVNPKGWSQRAKWGATLTLAIIVLVGIHLFTSNKCSGGDTTVSGNVIALLRCQSIADIGQWLSGVAGALAFLWLIIGYLQQGEELRLQRDELELQREEMQAQRVEMARQASAIEATEKLTRQDSFFRFAAFLVDQMNYDVVAVLKMIISNDELQGRKVRAGRADWAFYYEIMLDVFVDLEKNNELLPNLRARTRWARIDDHIKRFAEKFELLMKHSDAVDENEELRKVYEFSDQARIYLAFALVTDLKTPFKMRPMPARCADIV